MRISIVLALGLGFLSSWAQEGYQRARSPLDAKAIQTTPLWAQPVANVRALFSLEPEERLLVLGRQGAWLHVQARGQVGWIQNGSIQVLGVSQSVPPAPSEAPPSLTRAPVRREASPRMPRKHPLGVSLHYAKGLKSMEDSFRLQGAVGLASWGGKSAIDFFGGGGFKGARLIYGGPKFLQDLGIRILGAKLHFSTALPLYYFSAGDEKKPAIGTQTALELRKNLGEGNTKLTLGFPFEAILYGTGRTRITVLPALGLIF